MVNNFEIFKFKTHNLIKKYIFKKECLRYNSRKYNTTMYVIYYNKV